jgi:hypothetical protein
MSNSKSHRPQREHLRDLLYAAASQKLWGTRVGDTGLGDRFVSIRLISIGEDPSAGHVPQSIVHIRSVDVLVDNLDADCDGGRGWVAVDRSATLYEQRLTARSVAELQIAALSPKIGASAAGRDVPVTLDPGGPNPPITQKPPTTIKV